MSCEGVTTSDAAVVLVGRHAGFRVSTARASNRHGLAIGWSKPPGRRTSGVHWMAVGFRGL